jgi:uncharacterized membrane protein YkvA (DUF1232 family)
MKDGDEQRESGWRGRVRLLTRELRAISVAVRDPRTPRVARVLGICIVAYAVSPLDLIPDPIPVLGYVDDLVLVPLGVWMLLKLIPDDVMEDCRRVAGELESSVGGIVAAVVIVLLWIVTAALLTRALFAAAT